MKEAEILLALANGDRKEVARSTEVAHQIIADPSLMPYLMEGLIHGDETTRSHAAHACLTISQENLELLEAVKDTLITALMADQWELLEQMAKILPQLDLDAHDVALVAGRLGDVFEDSKSSIARTCALEAMVHLSDQYPALKGASEAMLQYALEEGTKAMQARARKLMGF